MQIVTFNQYISMIPNDTARYVRKLLAYLYNYESIEIGTKTLFYEEDKLLFKALRAYKQLGESYRNTATVLGDNNETYYGEPNLTDDDATNTFTSYYKIFTPFEYEEEYANITPEDIIRNIYDKEIIKNRDYVTTKHIDNVTEFMKGLKEVSEARKKATLTKMSTDFNDSLTISVMKYYDMVGKLFYYLRKHKAEIKNYDTDMGSLKTLAMLLAIFYYKHVTVYHEAYDEQQIIIDFLESKGITKESIKNAIEIDIDEKELNNIDSTLVLNKIYNGLPISKDSEKAYNVGYIYNAFLKNGIDNSVYLRKLLGLFNCTMSNLADINKVLDEKFNSMKSVNIEEVYSYMIPETISYLKHVAKIYTYLFNKKEAFTKDLAITLDKSIFVIALLMTAYEGDNTLKTFLVDKGMTQEKVLELLNLPSVEEFNKEVELTEVDEKAMAKFSNIILGGFNEGKSKDAIDKLSILTNICNQEFTGTSILPHIFVTITKEKLDRNCLDQISKYNEIKTEKRKRELTEELLKDIPIETFEFLKILSSYYQILKSKKLDPKDLEQLSIICAATRANKALEKYMGVFGITRTTLAKAFEVEFTYSSKKFDIDIIKDHFTPYVFDRPNEEITVYSVFENAFKPELTNTLNLRRVLNTFKKEPEDFLDIEEKMEERKKSVAAKERENKIEEQIQKLDEPAKKLMYDAFLIHDYLDNHKDKLKLIKTESDIKAISLLISILINAEEYLPYFTRNGITLDVVLTSIGLDKKEFETIKKSPLKRELIMEYTKYLGYSNIDVKTLVKELFDRPITPSTLIRDITESTGNNYSYLAEEVQQMKEREPSPDQGIRLLSKEEVQEIEDTSFTSIVDFGISISKHSKYINNAINALATADTIDHSLEGINGLLGEVTTEEVIEPEKKQTFLSKFFGSSKQQAQVIKKYNPEKIDELQDQVGEQIQTLSKELKGYEQIKNYIELFLKKLHDHLEYLKQYSTSFDSEELDETLDEIEKFTKTLDRNSGKEILQDKINTFETMILLMKQELITVHRAIINHFIAINSLQTSRSAILPLLTTEIALSAGKESEKEAFELAGGLVSLFGSVVNGNAEETKANLERLKLSAISDETYSSMSKEVNLYLESLSKSRSVLEAAKPAEVVIPPVTPVLETPTFEVTTPTEPTELKLTKRQKRAEEKRRTKEFQKDLDSREPQWSDD